MARRWGYQKKGIPENEAIIVCCKENFHGRTIAIISMSTDPDSYGNFGPFVPGIVQIDYNNADALKEVLEKQGDKVCCFLVEPIQGFLLFVLFYVMIWSNACVLFEKQVKLVLLFQMKDT